MFWCDWKNLNLVHSLFFFFLEELVDWKICSRLLPQPMSLGVHSHVTGTHCKRWAVWGSRSSCVFACSPAAAGPPAIIGVACRQSVSRCFHLLPCRRAPSAPKRAFGERVAAQQRRTAHAPSLQTHSHAIHTRTNFGQLVYRAAWWQEFKACE